jgi:signal transduction histidine kinase
LIEAQGGKLTVENRDGGGARFTIRLPVRVTDVDKMDVTA